VGSCNGRLNSYIVVSVAMSSTRSVRSSNNIVRRRDNAFSIAALLMEQTKMKNTGIAVLTLILLSVIGGCATGPMSFSKAGASEQEIRREADACGFEAKSRNMDGLLGFELKRLIEQCMRGKGYTVVPQ